MTGERHVGKRTKQQALLIALALLLSLPFATATDPISPLDDEQLVNAQPLLSWNDYTGEGLESYTLVLSSSPGLDDPLIEQTTTAPYYQLQQQLARGDWYWQVTATATDGGGASPINRFEIIDQPGYTIIPDFSRYEEDKRVDFLIDAPLGIALEIHITAEGFDLPFITSSLKKKRFTTFLDPGSYTLAATFTHQSLTTQFSTRFVVNPPVPAMHEITFTVSDEEEAPLQGALVTLEGEEDYQDTTDDEGIVAFTVKEGEYACTISTGGYSEESFEKTVDEQTALDIILKAEEEGAAVVTPTLTATASSAQDVITITSPTEQERLPDDSMDVTFTTTKSALASCDLLFKTATQQGWSVKGTIEGPGEEATIAAQQLPPGTARIMVRCMDKDSKTYDSPSKVIIIPEQPESHRGVADFLEEVDQASKGLQAADEPFLKHLNIPGRISAARKQLIDLDAQYQQLVAEGKNAEAEKLSDDIDDRLRDLTSTLVVKSRIADREETTTLMDRDEVAGLIGQHLQGTITDDAARERAQQLIMEDQEEHTFRTAVAVAELELLDGTKKYVTGITRTLQRFVDAEEAAPSSTIIESLPSSFLQVSGTPEVLGASGEAIATEQDGYLQFTLPEDNTYTLLFSGNVKDAADALDAAVIIPDKDYAALAAEEGGLFNSLTGAVVSVWERVGLDTASPWALLILVAIIATFVVNPFTAIPERQRSRRVRGVTEKMHDVLDLLEQGRHEEAFFLYPGIITSFERLSSQHQEELSFAISDLSSELHAFTFKQAINEASSKLFKLDSPKDLPEVAALTTRIISDYRELDPDTKERVKPLLLLYQEQLLTKQRTARTGRERFPRR